MIGLRENLNPSSPNRRFIVISSRLSTSSSSSSDFDSSASFPVTGGEGTVIVPKFEALPALPTMGKGNKKKTSPTTTARQPAPALLNEGEESSGVGGFPPSLSLGTTNNNEVHNRHSSCQDPLGNPPGPTGRVTTTTSTRIPPSLHYNTNPPSSMVNMTDEQLRTALDRWDDLEGEEGVTVGGMLSQLSAWWRKQTATTTIIDPTTRASGGAATAQQQSASRIIVGAVACLCSATLGAGILSLPFAMAEAGLACGMTLLVLSAIATSWSIRLLVQAMKVVVHSPALPPSNNNDNSAMQQQLQQQHNEETTTSYEDVVERCLGKQWRRVAEACMLVFCCGTAVAYVIAVGDIMQQAKLCHSKAVAKTLAWACVMVPLSMLRTMKSLECASSIGIASIATLVLAAFFHYWEHSGEQAPQLEEDRQQYFDWWNVLQVVVEGKDHHSIWAPTQGILSILRACPIILFAFSCQVNVCAIFEELPGQQQTEQQEYEEQQSSPSPAPAPAPATITCKANNSGEIQMDNNNPTISSPEHEPTPATTTVETSTTTNTITTTTTTTMACSKFHRMNQVTWFAVGICALLYSSISVIALKDFGSQKMTPNILTSYNPKSVMLVAFVGMAIAVTLAYPMNIFPARVTLLGLLRTMRQQRHLQQQEQLAVDDDLDDLEEPLLPPPSADSPETASTTKEENSDEVEVEQLQQHHQQAPPALSEVSESTPVSDVEDIISTPVTDFVDTSNALVEHVFATLFLTGLSLCLALVAPNISVVFGLLGGTSSSVLGFVIPGLVGLETANAFYADDAGAAKTTRIISIALVVSGTVVGVVTTAVTIYSTFAQ